MAKIAMLWVLSSEAFFGRSSDGSRPGAAPNLCFDLAAWRQPQVIVGLSNWTTGLPFLSNVSCPTSCMEM